jgi:hypothetical protein
MHLSVRIALGFIIVPSLIKAQPQAPGAGSSLTVRISTEFSNGVSGNVTTMRHRMTDHAIRWEVTKVTSGQLPSLLGHIPGGIQRRSQSSDTTTSIYLCVAPN